jgi:hypothetical protein
MAWLTSLVRRVAAFELQDAMTANETITIGDQVYTYKAAVGATANEVLIGADQTASALNLAAAINLGDTAGTNYGSATVLNSYASAVQAGPVVTLTFKEPGIIANGIALAEGGDVTMTTQSVAGSGDPETFWTQVLSMTQCPAEVIDAIRHYTVAAD